MESRQSVLPTTAVQHLLGKKTSKMQWLPQDKLGAGAVWDPALSSTICGEEKGPPMLGSTFLSITQMGGGISSLTCEAPGLVWPCGCIS